MLDKKPSGLEIFDLRAAQERFDLEFARAVSVAKTVGGRVLELPMSLVPFRTPEMLEVPEDLQETLMQFDAYYKGRKKTESKVFEYCFKPNQHFDDFLVAVQDTYGLDLRPQQDTEHTRIVLPNSTALIDIHRQYDDRARAVTGHFYKGIWAS